MQPAGRWVNLPPLPQPLAGQCVGTVGDLLVVAGGSSWTAPPWNGGIKKWTDDIYALAPGEKQWRLFGHLPQPMGYGSAVQTGEGLLCIGGENGKQTLDTVFYLKTEGGQLSVQSLSRLPQPVANASAGLAGNRIYLVGGQRTLDPDSASDEIWSLDLSNLANRSWRRFSGPRKEGRILPVVAGCGSDLYVVSGADLVPDKKGGFHRIYLNDAWLLKDGARWEKLPDVPAPVVGAPSACSSEGELMIFGGDNGSLAAEIFTLKDSHPGFSRRTLRFNPSTRRWSYSSSRLPLSLVTSGSARWNGLYVIAGGENKPGHRSSEVIGLPISGERRHESK